MVDGRFVVGAVNASTAEDLQRIPGVGPTISDRILQLRPFATLEALRAVPGIGPKRFHALMCHLQPIVDDDTRDGLTNSPSCADLVRVSEPTHVQCAQGTDALVGFNPVQACIQALLCMIAATASPVPTLLLLDLLMRSATNITTVARVCIRMFSKAHESRIIVVDPFACAIAAVAFHAQALAFKGDRGLNTLTVRSVYMPPVVRPALPRRALRHQPLPSYASFPPSAPAPPLLLGTWNIRHLSKARPMDSIKLVLAVLARFDVIALQVPAKSSSHRTTHQHATPPQEVRDVVVIKRLVNLLHGYAYVVSPPVGRHNHSAEHYCYFYRKRLGLTPTIVENEPTTAASFVRPPFVVAFDDATSRTTVPSHHHRRYLVLVNLHVVFGQRQQRHDELGAVKAMLPRLAQTWPRHHVVLLGDFNLPPFDIGPIRDWSPVVRAPQSTTIFNSLYDNIWLHDAHDVSGDGPRGVWRIDHEFFPDTLDRPYASADARQARRQCNQELSDHCPVFVAI
ncbi:Aste57867_14497 [Aphanomyces stellatus]|uniref:Aste57867_14497 protein n=1 Tax=Aphanomyces stellatus TaxID=120398 RepID=A0A485L1M8_9STRA|nr:hypothetical protein As57867_014443 [Aphanomyces stellatus]VFT91319.1 Aste57867_14497 [Aphanomyces stellatus]